MQSDSIADQELDASHLRNDTVRRRLDAIANDIKTLFVRILQNAKFSLALVETTVCNGYVFFLHMHDFNNDSQFIKKMLFCESAQTTTTVKEVYNVVKKFITDNDCYCSF